MHLLVLSAFRREDGAVPDFGSRVSMHLLVLSAFRLDEIAFQAQAQMSQCTFWCSVLSDMKAPIRVAVSLQASQCTFWCSVLSDGVSISTISRTI